MKKMLIADDNKQITTILSGYAKKEGFEPVVALDGAEALDKYLQYEHEIAVVLLDVMMPEIDGFEVCRRLRKESMVPIIMITARGEDYDKIMGLDIGADDYVIKPFSAPEVMARVRAVLRRLGAQEPANAQTLSYANLYINLEKYAVQINGEDVALTKKKSSFYGRWRKILRRFSAVIICWTVSGVMTISVTAVLSIRISSACALSWISTSTLCGKSKLSGA